MRCCTSGKGERCITVGFCSKRIEGYRLRGVAHIKGLSRLSSRTEIGVPGLIGIDNRSTGTCDGDGAAVRSAAGGHTSVQTRKYNRIARSTAGGRYRE